MRYISRTHRHKEEVEATDEVRTTPMGNERGHPFYPGGPYKDNNNTLAITGHPFYPGGPYEGQILLQNDNPNNSRKWKDKKLTKT